MDASPPRPLALAPRLHPRAGPHPSAARRHLTRRILTDDQPRARANPDALDAGRETARGRLHASARDRSRRQITQATRPTTPATPPAGPVTHRQRPARWIEA